MSEEMPVRVPEHEQKKPLLDHLNDLLVRARRAVWWILAGVGVAYLFSNSLVEWIEVPVRHLEHGPQLIVTKPFEKIWVNVRISLVAGLFLMIPLIGYEIAAFIGPGLKPHEKRRIFWLTFSIYFSFALGLLLGYFYILPAVLRAVMHFGFQEAQPLWTLSSYMSAALGVLVLSGVFMEIPVVMTHLSAWGWVEPQTWARGRRYALVMNAVLSGLLAPPDVMSMIAMMIPVQVLYESGILLARVARWGSHGKNTSLPPA